MQGLQHTAAAGTARTRLSICVSAATLLQSNTQESCQACGVAQHRISATPGSMGLLSSLGLGSSEEDDAPKMIASQVLRVEAIKLYLVPMLHYVLCECSSF